MKFPFQLVLFFPLMLLAGEVRQGMLETELLATMGKPSNILKGGKKAIYEWPTLKATVVDGVVVEYQNKVEIERRELNPEERAAINAVFDIKKGISQGLTRESYDIYIKDLNSKIRALTEAGGDTKLITTLDDYSEAHALISYIWSTEGWGGNLYFPKIKERFYMVFKKDNPRGFRLIHDAIEGGVTFPDMQSGPDYYRLISISEFWTYTERRYWLPIENRLRVLTVK